MLTTIVLGYTGMNENTTYATDAAAAIMMLVFQYVTEGGERYVSFQTFPVNCC